MPVLLLQIKRAFQDILQPVTFHFLGLPYMFIKPWPSFFYSTKHPTPQETPKKDACFVHLFSQNLNTPTTTSCHKQILMKMAATNDGFIFCFILFYIFFCLLIIYVSIYSSYTH